MSHKNTVAAEAIMKLLESEEFDKRISPEVLALFRDPKHNRGLPLQEIIGMAIYDFAVYLYADAIPGNYDSHASKKRHEGMTKLHPGWVHNNWADNTVGGKK
jgi:hypothetical protein